MTDQHGGIEPMLTTTEVARFLNVHINTVRRWSNKGVLKSYRIGSRGDRRFKKVDVDALIEGKTAARKGRKGSP